MTQRIPFSEASVNKSINHEQLNQIIEAILAGKYSWACFLLLRCTGYDPLQYIPYRTYNRLLKENCCVGNSSRQTNDRIKTESQVSENNFSSTPSQGLSKIKDLGYLEVVGKQKAQVRGGCLLQLFDFAKLKINDLNLSIK
jgi:hypothetical protein